MYPSGMNGTFRRDPRSAGNPTDYHRNTRPLTTTVCEGKSMNLSKHAGHSPSAQFSGKLFRIISVPFGWGELFVWSVVVRLLIAGAPLSKTLQLLDIVPYRVRRAADAVSFPSERQVRFAGACLGRSLARSQYLRLRGVSHSVVIGAAGGSDGFRAHAWVDPFEAPPQGFVVLRAIER
jgi:hypothetical protein